MSKSKKNDQLSLTKVFQIIGKPFFFIFAFLLILIATYLHLLKVFVGNFSKIRFPQFSLPRLSIKFPKTILFLIILIFFGGSFYQYILKDLPDPTSLSSNPPALSTKILDRHGNLLYQIYKDENRTLIDLKSLPPHIINATLAAEDKNFYHHPGVDFSGIIRALYKNLKSCQLLNRNCPLEGGSTLTQQLVKNTLLSSEKTITRKLKELVLALQIEDLYDKDTILEMYLNQVPYGGTAYGIEEASWQYYGKSSSDLSLGEAALLSGLPVAPTTLSPFGTNPYLAKIRQEQVLSNMKALSYISDSEYHAALAEPLNFRPQGNTILAPHFVMYIRDLLVQMYGESLVSRGGLTVTTSLDLNLQNMLQASIVAELDKLTGKNVGNGAGLIISPKTGEILAMVGSRDFFDTTHDGQVNIVIQPRQPGSAIKPLTYALAFMRGLSPSSLITDSPICFEQSGSPSYCPRNYDGNFHGTITLKTALASSYNIPAIKLLNSIGVANLVELGQTLGLTTWQDPTRFGLALTLGGGEVKMLELAQAYAVFANKGYKVPLNPILSVTSTTPLPNLYTPDESPTRQVIPESVAFQISQSLSDNAARSPAFGINSILNIPGKTVAVKTGTTNNLRDNWTIGYTPDYLVATWVGNNDNSPMSSVVSGITGASPIWNKTMQTLLQDAPPNPFTPPPTLVKARVSCSSTLYDYFIKGQEPKLNCNLPKVGEVL